MLRVVSFWNQVFCIWKSAVSQYIDSFRKSVWERIWLLLHYFSLHPINLFRGDFTPPQFISNTFHQSVCLYAVFFFFCAMSAILDINILLHVFSPSLLIKSSSHGCKWQADKQMFVWPYGIQGTNFLFWLSSKLHCFYFGYHYNEKQFASDLHKPKFFYRTHFHCIHLLLKL